MVNVLFCVLQNYLRESAQGEGEDQNESRAEEEYIDLQEGNRLTVSDLAQILSQTSALPIHAADAVGDSKVTPAVDSEAAATDNEVG